MSPSSAPSRAAAQLLVGRVMHERLRPVAHRFTYPVFSVCVDIDRLPEAVHHSGGWFGLQRWRPLSLSLHDHGARDGGPLGPWIRGHLRSAGLPADGTVLLQTFPRVFGLGFKPVSFWYCHDRDGLLRAVYAEVNNTFGEHHGYLLAAADGGAIGSGTPLACRKRFHVSPFCAVTGTYRFTVRVRPGFRGMAVDHDDEAGPLLRTAVGGREQPCTAGAIVRTLVHWPLQGLSIISRIHWQALRLWLKRVPFHGKPPPPVQAIDVARGDLSSTAPLQEPVP